MVAQMAESASRDRRYPSLNPALDPMRQTCFKECAVLMCILVIDDHGIILIIYNE